MEWGKPWRGQPDEAPPAPRASRSSIVAIASLAAHFAGVAWWLLACTPSPLPAPRVPSLARPAIRVALVHAAPEAEAKPRPRFDWLAVNPARPEVLMAWSSTELAYSRDDGLSFAVALLPWSSGRREQLGRNGVVTPSGAALIELDRDSWVKTADAATWSAQPSPLRGEIAAWTSDARRILAVIAADDGAQRFFVSTDDGSAWKEGPQPESDVYDIAVRPGGRVVTSWAWSASCGGGGEGHATWATGDAEWKVESRAPIAPLGADDWIYGSTYDSTGSFRVVHGFGPHEREAIGPSLPQGGDAWFATDGRVTFVGIGTDVLSARSGVFSPYDYNAPAELHSVAVDGRGRIVGLSARGIVRREGAGIWSELPVPTSPP